VTKIYYLELLRASEGTLSRWSRLHLQSLAPTPVSRRVDVRQAAGRKIIAESLSQHDEKHVVPTPLSGIRVGRRYHSRFNPKEASEASQISSETPSFYQNDSYEEYCRRDRIAGCWSISRLLHPCKGLVLFYSCKKLNNTKMCYKKE
jgi:hypothetical protein